MSETMITDIYDNPADPEAFEAAYGAVQLEASRRVPGYIRFEASKVWPKEDGSPTPAHRMIACSTRALFATACRSGSPSTRFPR